MRYYSCLSRKVFVVFLSLTFFILCFICLIPFIHVLALSFSHKVPSMQRLVTLYPLTFDDIAIKSYFGFDWNSYIFVLEREEFLRAFLISVIRIVLAGVITLLIVIMAAYPLSKNNKNFNGRTIYVWYIMITMFISGGLVPWYLVVRGVGLLNTIWALVIPGCAPPFMIVLLLNFFRGIPKSLEESAFLDGAGHFRILVKIFIPLSAPSIATITLFIIVSNWNSWFDGIIFMTSQRNYPLQSYLQTLIASTSMQMMSRARAELLKNISDRTVKSAQIFIAAVPMLILYPFLQRYFMSGIILGSVKE